MDLLPCLSALSLGAVLVAALLWRIRAQRHEIAALRCSEARFRAFIERAPVPICLSDDDGALRFANDAFRTLYGLPAGSDPAGGPLAGFFALGQRGAILDHIRRRRIGEAVPASCQTVALRADGGEFPIQLAMTRLDPGSGPCSIGFHLDLSDLRRTEAALFAAERDAVLGRMAGRVAHEVNNPLEAIKIYIEPLRKRVQDRPEVDRGLAVIDQQVDRIARLVRGLLSFVRQRTLHRSSVRIGEIVQTVVELLQPRFAKKNKRLEVVLPVEPHKGALDVDGVQQVLINLLENALAAIPSGGWVRLECESDGIWLRIRISDNGPGLGPDPEVLFRPFATTKAEGTGLGLTVARRICEAHGGWLKGGNRPEGGALFELALRMDRTTTVVRHDDGGKP